MNLITPRAWRERESGGEKKIINMNRGWDPPDMGALSISIQHFKKGRVEGGCVVGGTIQPP